MVTRLEEPIEIPRQWYNIVPDLPAKLPPVLDPQTRTTADKKLLHRTFIGELARHEYSGERFIPIPEEVRQVYSIWRPTPLVRARHLEEALHTPARIYYKNETGSPPGSHKANAAVAQAYYAAKEGIERLVTSTTAGQWGTALAFACSVFGVKCTIYMSRSSYEGKPYRKDLAEGWGAEIFSSPSRRTKVGREILRKDPNGPGTMSIAKSEALEDARSDPDARNAVGSIMNFVLATQTVVGEEAMAQLRGLDDYPDMVVGCVGGGSNFSGIFWPFYRDGVARTEGVLPAPETAHAIRAVIDEAKRCKSSGEKKVILFNLCGHGLLDIEAYREFNSGKMKANDADPAEIKKSIAEVKALYPWLYQ